MNYFEKISRFTFLFGLLLLPSFVLLGSSYPFNFGKFVFIGIIISVSFFFLVLSKKDIFFPSKDLLLYFSIVFTLSFFSSNMELSVLSSPIRFSEGLIVDLIILMSCILVLSLFKKINLDFIIFVSSLPVIFVGLIESFTQSDRIISTFGQPNFLSLFLVLSILSIFRYFRDKNIFLSFLISIPYIFLIITSASVTSFIIFLVIFCIFLRYEKIIVPKKILIILTIGTLFLIMLKGNILWMKLNDILRQTNISTEHTFISDSLDVRLILWEKTLELILNPSYFFQGHGSNTFLDFFENQRPEKLNFTSEKDFIFDKPHNYYLEIIFSYGIIGFIGFVYLITKSIKTTGEYTIPIVAILFFLFFHWFDITLKLFFFLFITLNLKDKKISLNSNHSLIVIPIIIFLNLFTRILYDKKEDTIQKQFLRTVSKHIQ